MSLLAAEAALPHMVAWIGLVADLLIMAVGVCIFRMLQERLASVLEEVRRWRAESLLQQQQILEQCRQLNRVRESEYCSARDTDRGPGETGQKVKP